MPTSTVDQRSCGQHLSSTMSNSSQNTYSAVSIPTSPPPPTDLPTYSRSMHQHTKQQMEAASHSSRRRSGRHSSQAGQQPNGVSAAYSPPTGHPTSYH